MPDVVALLAEGVGRNRMSWQPKTLAYVALLAEGVGRNKSGRLNGLSDVVAPSSRRAGVEIKSRHRAGHYHGVALLAEGVGRNIG